MSHAEKYSPAVKIRVIYEDLPDLIELETELLAGNWTGVATSYASPADLAEACSELASWTRQPSAECRIEAGGDSGIGYLSLVFYTVNLSLNAACYASIAAADHTGRKDRVSRLSIELQTELGLVERFARQLSLLAEHTQKVAILECLA
jgi:hypothetical protein